MLHGASGSLAVKFRAGDLIFQLFFGVGAVLQKVQRLFLGAVLCGGLQKRVQFLIVELVADGNAAAQKRFRIHLHRRFAVNIKL